MLMAAGLFGIGDGVNTAAKIIKRQSIPRAPEPPRCPFGGPHLVGHRPAVWRGSLAVGDVARHPLKDLLALPERLGQRNQPRETAHDRDPHAEWTGHPAAGSTHGPGNPESEQPGLRSNA